jgi:hypothetical protein
VFYLLFSLFSCKWFLYSCLAIYRVLIFLSNILFPYIPVKYDLPCIWLLKVFCFGQLRLSSVKFFVVIPCPYRQIEI